MSLTMHTGMAIRKARQLSMNEGMSCLYPCYALSLVIILSSACHTLSGQGHRSKVKVKDHQVKCHYIVIGRSGEMSGDMAYDVTTCDVVV